ncbi:MAG: sigma-70 family RNA polymerase sigma factor [Thermoguttaceae bacterium]
MSRSADHSYADGDRNREFCDQWRENEAELLAFCRKRTHREQDAQEVLAEVSEDAWRNYGGFRGECSFLTWVTTIALCKIADLGRRQARQCERETRLQAEHESIPAVLEKLAPSDADAAAWVATVIPRAVEARHLTPSEAAVLLARLSQRGVSWNEIGKSLQMTAAHCRKLHARATAGLAVYMVVHCPDPLGGPAAIRDAFQSAQADKKDPVTAEEIEAFENAVFSRRIDHHHRGSQEPLRSACTKVCRKIARANLFTPAPAPPEPQT